MSWRLPWVSRSATCNKKSKFIFMVEFVSKRPSLTQALPTWRWLLWASIALFILVVLGYFGLRFYLAQLYNEAIGLNNQIEEAAAAVNIQDEQTVLRFNDSLNAVRSLFANHTYFSSFFNLVSSSTYPKIIYRSLRADAAKNSVQFQGTAQSYTALAKQIVALRALSFIKGVEVSGIAFSTEGLQFSLNIEVKPDIFRQTK